MEIRTLDRTLSSRVHYNQLKVLTKQIIKILLYLESTQNMNQVDGSVLEEVEEGKQKINLAKKNIVITNEEFK